MSEYVVIFSIVNEGFSDSVMSAARAAGAKGGTVVSARGTANEQAKALFDIEISGEKEIVIILVDNNIKDDILQAINKEVGLNKPGQGIVFSMPVDSVVGLSNN